jgi:hypothetical protein
MTLKRADVKSYLRGELKKWAPELVLTAEPTRSWSARPRILPEKRRLLQRNERLRPNGLRNPGPAGWTTPDNVQANIVSFTYGPRQQRQRRACNRWFDNEYVFVCKQETCADRSPDWRAYSPPVPEGRAATR